MKKRGNNKGAFLGKGWSFPPTFHDYRGQGVEMVENEVDIKQSLEILLGTSLGERLMVPEYGCDLMTYLFDAISTTRVHFLRELIRTAILKYEPRIDLNEIHIDQTDYLEGIIRIKVDYSIIVTNTRFNLVFPYYRVEGTGIPQLYQKQVTQNLKKQINND